MGYSRDISNEVKARQFLQKLKCTYQRDSESWHENIKVIYLLVNRLLSMVSLIIFTRGWSLKKLLASLWRFTSCGDPEQGQFCGSTMKDASP